MDFIRLISDKASHAFYNMSLDEAISESVRKKLSPPTLRLYEWDRPSLSIGYFQKIADVDVDYCSRNNYPVVRRLTGGRAILHDAELTYSFSSLTDSSMFRDNLMDNYKLISSALVSGLKLCGINAKMSLKRKRNTNLKNPACFKSVSFGEITAEDRKIIGSAQKRYKDGFLQHGSVILSFNAEELCSALGHSDSDKFNDIGAITDHNPNVSAETLRSSFKKSFERALKVKVITDMPSKYELKLARKLEETKYATREWNYRR